MLKFEKTPVSYKDWSKKPSTKRALETMLKGIIPFGNKIPKLNVNDSGNSYTNGTVIVVSPPNSWVDNSYKSLEGETLWLAMAYGLLGHEIGHILFSDFSDLEMLKKWINRQTFANQSVKKIVMQLSGRILNIIEDGAIERLMVLKYCGLITRFNILNHFIRQSTKSCGDDILSSMLGQLLVYTKTGLDAVDYAESEKVVKDFFRDVQEFIDQGVESDHSEGRLEATKNILLTLATYLEDLVKEDPTLGEDSDFEETSDYEGCGGNNDDVPDQPEEWSNPLRAPRKDPSEESNSEEEQLNSEKGEGNSEEEQPNPEKREGNSEEEQPNPEKEEGSSEEDGNSEEDSKELNEAKGSSNNSSDFEESNNSNSNESSNSNTSSSDKEPDSSQLPEDPSSVDPTDIDEDLIEKLKKELEQQIKNAQDSIDKEEAIRNDGDLSKETLKNLDMDLNIEHAQLTPETPSPDLILKGKQLARKLEFKKTKEESNLKKGILNTRQLYKVGTKDPTLFCRKPVDTEGVVLYTLVDNSGSMDFPIMQGECIKTSIQLGFEAATVLEVAAKELGIPLKIVGYNTNETSTHMVIKGFKESSKQGSFGYAASTKIPAACWNVDALHITTASLELKKRPEPKKFLFVICDGLPSSAGSGDGIAETATAVENSIASDISVVGIYIGPETEDNKTEENFRKIYGNNMVFTKPENLTTVLSSVVNRML